ncbi:MAG: hypothetical protein IBX36_05710 [Dehalococcoidia bacterium]|nr:hypothetical protein [Dehalococcoidia bacterium]
MACVSSFFRSNPGVVRGEFGILLSLPRQGKHRLGGFNGLERSKSFRSHRVGLDEFLEEWYDRSAENCELFVNISEVDKYCVTCTVCRHFKSGGCGFPDVKGPSILKLLKTSYNHDGLTWE